MPKGVKTGKPMPAREADPASKHLESARDFARLKAAEMYLRGTSIREISAELGVTYVTVSKYMEENRREWQSRRLLTMDAIKDETLARLDKLEHAAWKAWDKSCADTTVHRREMAPPMMFKRDKDQGGKGKPAPAVNPQPIPPVLMREVVESRSSAGNPAFLQQVAWCIEARCKVLGVLKDVGGTTAVTLNWATMAAGYSTAALPDPVGDALAAAERKAEEDAAKLPPRETTVEVK